MRAGWEVWLYTVGTKARVKHIIHLYPLHDTSLAYLGFWEAGWAAAGPSPESYHPRDRPARWLRDALSLPPMVVAVRGTVVRGMVVRTRRARGRSAPAFAAGGELRAGPVDRSFLFR